MMRKSLLLARKLGGLGSLLQLASWIGLLIWSLSAQKTELRSIRMSLTKLDEQLDKLTGRMNKHIEQTHSMMYVIDPTHFQESQKNDTTKDSNH